MKKHTSSARWVDWLTVALSLIWMLPLIFAVLFSVRPADQPLTNGNIFFGTSLTLENYRMAWSLAPWGTHYVNSIIFVVGVLVVQFITVTPAAYAFARMRFLGRNVLLLIMLTQILIPNGVLLAQNFTTIRNLGLFDTHWAMMIVYWGSAFGVLLLRGAFRAVPLELEEAARMDGANLWQVIRHVYVPLTVPSYVAFAIVSVSSHWNEFLYPLIVTRSDAVRPLTVGLNKLVQSSEVGALYHQQMAGTILVIAPLVVLFMIFQRRFIESFAQSGIK